MKIIAHFQKNGMTIQRVIQILLKEYYMSNNNEKRKEIS